MNLSESFKRRIERLIPNINWTAITDYRSLVAVGIPRCAGCDVPTSLREGDYCSIVCQERHV